MKKKIIASQKKLIEAWNTNDKKLLESVSTKKVVRNVNGKQMAGSRDEYAGLMDFFRAAFPDLKVVMDNYKLDGRKVYMNWTATGTNKGAFGDYPPTRKKVSVKGFSIWSYNGKAKATREDAFYDNLDMYQQLGFSLTAPVVKKTVRKAPAKKAAVKKTPVKKAARKKA